MNAGDLDDAELLALQREDSQRLTVRYGASKTAERQVTVAHFLDGFSVVFSRGLFPLLTTNNVAAVSDDRILATITQMYKDAARQVVSCDPRYAHELCLSCTRLARAPTRMSCLWPCVHIHIYTTHSARI